jgi:hypothetical protein
MTSYTTGAGPMAVKIADLNNDSFLDVVVANLNGNTTSILLGYGNGSFQWHSDLWNGLNAGTNGIAIDDINHDNHLDIVVVNRKASNIGVFLGEGYGNFSKQVTFSTGNGSTPAGLALGDLNNDNFLDVVVTDHENDKLHVFFGRGDGTFLQKLTLFTGNYSGPYLVLIKDFNSDNRSDIAVGCGDGNNIGIFLSNGTGTFSEEMKYNIESGPYALDVADFNGDGIVDIVSGNYNSNDTTILFGHIDGTFTKQKSFSTGIDSLPYAVLSKDFNRDNIQDLIVANSGTDNIGILIGYKHEKFQNLRTYSTGIGSYPVDVAVADLNNDKKLDFISANHMNNSIGVFLSTCS